MPDDMITDAEREVKEREIAEKILKRLTNTLHEVDNVEPLGDLNVPVKDVLATVLALKNILSPDDSVKMLLIIGILYGCKDEYEFMLRLAKTMKDLTQEMNMTNMEITSEE
jgi:hypothetical protein